MPLQRTYKGRTRGAVKVYPLTRIAVQPGAAAVAAAADPGAAVGPGLGHDLVAAAGAAAEAAAGPGVEAGRGAGARGGPGVEVGAVTGVTGEGLRDAPG
jgi:hypothetical protein